MIFDTDVLIWFFRGNSNSIALIEGTADRAISVVGYMEYLQGARDCDEVHKLKAFLARRGFQTLPLSENIGNRASVYMEAFGLSSGLGMGDALIAATAAENHLTLCTANRRHFAVISGLQLKIFRP